jgi:hypothetical protein
VTEQTHEQEDQHAGGLDLGAGWIDRDAGLGYIAIDHQQQAYVQLPHPSQRALALEDQAEQRQAQAHAAELADALENRAWILARSGHQFRTHSEVLATRWRAAAPCDGCGHLEACRCAGETLADRRRVPSVGNRAGLRRLQRERVEAKSVTERRLEALQAELTHLRALVAGGR